MSNSIVRGTVWITAGVWAVLILAVTIQSMLGVTVAGARPEASRLIIMMTLPFTVGTSVVAIGAAIGHRVVAEPLAACQRRTTETVKLHLELEGEVGEVVRALRRIGGGDRRRRRGSGWPEPCPNGGENIGCGHCSGAGYNGRLLQRWRPAAGRRSWLLPTSRRAWM